MKLKGSIDEIRFRNDENGYTIAVLDVEGEPIVAVGNFPPVSEGEEVEVFGEYVIHAKFGKQFKVSDIKPITPQTADGIVRFLGSGLIKGVGPKTALAIVSTFGKDALEVIEKFPNRLATIRGITPSRAVAISEAYLQNKKAQDAIMYLQSQDISLGTALKIYKFYGDETEKIVSQNPYKLIEDIDGIGFVTADRIALRQGLPTNSPFRIRAGLLHELDQAGENGNTYLPIDELVPLTAQLLSCEQASVEDEIDGLVIDGKIKSVPYK